MTPYLVPNVYCASQRYDITSFALKQLFPLLFQSKHFRFSTGRDSSSFIDEPLCDSPGVDIGPWVGKFVFHPRLLATYIAVSYTHLTLPTKA